MLLTLLATMIFGVASGFPATFGPNVSMDGGYPIAPNPQTPDIVKEAWLRCNEDKKCQDVDAEFAFPNEKMIVWVNVEKGQNYKKLSELLKPLMDSGHVELRPVHHEIQKGVSAIKTPPPSFWTNSELIGHFQDSTPWDMGASNPGRPYVTTMLAPPAMYETPVPMLTWGPRTETATSSVVFGPQLLLFARDTLKYDTRMSRYASNLPALVRVAFNSEETPALSLRALTVCRDYAQRLQKYEKKLKNNLSMALPVASRTGRKTTPVEQTTITKATAFDFAVALFREIQDLSSKVYKFMYPDNQTVTLADLHDPSLIQSLEKIQGDTVEFMSFIH